MCRAVKMALIFGAGSPARVVDHTVRRCSQLARNTRATFDRTWNAELVELKKMYEKIYNFFDFFPEH